MENLNNPISVPLVKQSEIKPLPTASQAELKPTQPLPVKEEKKIPAHLPETDINKVPKKKSIFLVWILSLITLDVYTTVWYMQKSEEFYNLGTRKRLGNTLPLTLLAVNILLVALIIIFPITITPELLEEMGYFYQRLTILQTGILFAIGFLLILKVFFTLLIAFYSRTIINQALENKESKTKVSVFFTLIFTHLYLQYEINKIIDDKEDHPKIGPWVFILLILILIAAGIIIQYF